jgi:hypothetical protein
MTDATAPWENRLEDEQVATDADQSEMKAVRFGTINIDEGLRDESLASEFATSEDRENRAGKIGDEIQRRSRMLGDFYPFDTSGNSLIHRPIETCVYGFCLSISLVPSLSDRHGRRYQIAFERLTRDVMQCFFGTGTSAYRTGVPGDKLEIRPNRIKAKISEIRELTGSTGEWNWRPEYEFPDNPTAVDVGDLGMDVVVWKLMPDNRRGNFYCLGQCACGLTDWADKFDEPNFGRLKSWINPLSDVAPLKFFPYRSTFPTLRFSVRSTDKPV